MFLQKKILKLQNLTKTGLSQSLGLKQMIAPRLETTGLILLNTKAIKLIYMTDQLTNKMMGLTKDNLKKSMKKVLVSGIKL